MRRKFVFALILCCLLPALMQAQRERPRPSPWRQFAQPTTKNLKTLSCIDTARVWFGGEGGTIMRTTNGGVSWSLQYSDSTAVIMDMQMLNARIGWAISWIYFTDTSEYYGSEILKTTNGGMTWSSLRFEENDRYYHGIHFLDSLVGFIVGNQGDIQRTSDGGATWSKMHVDSSVASGFPALNVQFATRSLGFATGGHFDITGVIWRTTNGGLSWSAESIAPEPIYRVHFVDTLNIIGICGDYDYGTSMVRTKDGGRNWEYTYLNVFGLPTAIAFRTASEAWVPAGNLLMVTTDTARTWHVVDTLSGWRAMYDMAFVNRFVGYAVADSGFVFKYDQRRPIPASQHDEVAENTSSLTGNYPNPFNPTTWIRFTIAEKGTPQDVSLEVYDVLGRKVATLVNEKRDAGEYSAEWDASAMASGVYLYKLVVGPFVEVRKMLLMR